MRLSGLVQLSWAACWLLFRGWLWPIPSHQVNAASHQVNKAANHQVKVVAVAEEAAVAEESALSRDRARTIRA